MDEINIVAFDLGGVLLYQDYSRLSSEEAYLLNLYMNRKNIDDFELIKYAKSKLASIYLKVHVLNENTLETLDMLKSEGIRPSIWTNNIEEINYVLEHFKITKYIEFEDIINSFFLGSDKPCVEFYYKALRQLGSEKERVLFFDDSIKNVVAARKIGIKSRVYNIKDNLKEYVMCSLKGDGYYGYSKVR